jgi:hypothetical protein
VAAAAAGQREPARQPSHPTRTVCTGATRTLPGQDGQGPHVTPRPGPPCQSVRCDLPTRMDGRRAAWIPGSEPGSARPPTPAPRVAFNEKAASEIPLSLSLPSLYPSPPPSIPLPLPLSLPLQIP